MVRLRIEGDSADEVKAVADTIESFFPQHVTFSPVKEGGNPKYSGQQKFFSYATLQPNPPAPENP
jgi:hypothetical protein